MTGMIALATHASAFSASHPTNATNAPTTVSDRIVSPVATVFR